MFNIDQHILEKLKSKLEENFKDRYFDFKIEEDIPSFSIKKDFIVELMKFLKTDIDLDFNFLTTLCGMHYTNTNELGIVYHLHSFKNNLRIRIKSRTSIENPSFSSICKIYNAANWMEREAYDFFGINFTNHPNLKRILNVEDFDAFPLRKDFPLEDQTREDKNNAMFGR